MMFLFPNILSNFCVPTLFKEYYEKHSGEAVGRGQTAPMRHPKVSQSFSLGGLTAVNVGKHSNSSIALSPASKLAPEISQHSPAICAPYSSLFVHTLYGFPTVHLRPYTPNFYRTCVGLVSEESRRWYIAGLNGRR